MNYGQLLSSLSGLSGVSAATHLSAITGGTGRTIFASQFSVCIDQPSITVVRRATRVAAQPAATSPVSKSRQRSKNAYVKTEVDVLYLVQATKTTSIAQGKKNQVLSSSERIVGVL